MTRARKELISLEATPYYHCVSRCVRRAFLCGEDRFTGKSYEHRREWIVERLRLLTNVFCIDVCAYAVMSNHWHVVVKVDSEKQKQLSNQQVIDRWRQLYSGNVLIGRYLSGVELTKPELDVVDEVVDKWRERLCDISWFMRCVNETIAREANAEDQCTGRFWEGRFKSQALLDEASLLAVMAYVDLNPIRAAMAETPEDSEFTSIQSRIQNDDEHLMLFVGGYKIGKPNGIPFEWVDYLELVDWSGRVVHPKKIGFINSRQPPILQRLGLDELSWQSCLDQLPLLGQQSVCVERLLKSDRQRAA